MVILGWEAMLDEEFKVMGTAPYGDPNRIKVSNLVDWDERRFRVNTLLVNCIGWRRYKKNGQGTYFSPKLVEQWGPRREGNEIDEPYIHIAAAVQRQLEEIVLALTDHYLEKGVRQTRRLCYAGGVALNVECNQRRIDYLGCRVSYPLRGFPKPPILR